MLVESDKLFPILGYRIIKQLYSGKKTLVYRAIRQKDQQSVILKLMRNEDPNFTEINQFHNQYTITQNLEIPGIVKPINLEKYHNRYVIVMEDFGGIALNLWQQEEQKKGNYSVSLSEFFGIAIEISATLERLHHHRIIHKDIKPANILIHPITGKTRIIDFSIFTPENDRQLLSFSTRELENLSLTNAQIPKYKFVHDRVQQATYSLIPKDEIKQIHLKIGLLLLNNTPVAEREENIFELVNHFNIAAEFITHQAKRNELAEMSLMAGRKALVSTAYSSALKYLTIGIELLADDSWDTKYDLTLALYNTATEAAYLSGDFESTEKFVQVVLLKAKTPLDQVKAYEVKIQSYGAQGKELEAVHIAKSFLKTLGVEFPTNPSQSDIQLAIETTSAKLANRSIQDLIELPEITEAQPLIIMRILSSSIGLAYTVAPELLLFIILKQINLSIKFGNSPLSAFAYVMYGVMLCGVIGDIDSGYKFGKLADSLLPNFQTKEVTGKVMETFNHLVRHWKEHLKQTLKPLLESYTTNLEVGDMEFAAYALYGYSQHAYFTGHELIKLEQDIEVYSKTIRQIKQERVFYWNEIFRQTILNLLGDVQNPQSLIGTAYDEEKMLPLHLKAKDGVALFFLYFCKLQVCYLLADYSQALKNTVMAEKYLYAGVGMFVTAQFYFYDSLTHLAVYSDFDEFEQKEILHRVTENQKKMQNWGDQAPMNHLHKFYLVEAERHRVLNQYLEAIDNYEKAISLAKENDYINEEALACELEAIFYLKWGKQRIAQFYLTDAYYCYVRWGALAKVYDLQKSYPQLLLPIIQQEGPSYSYSEKNLPELSLHLSTLSNKSTLIHAIA